MEIRIYLEQEGDSEFEIATYRGLSGNPFKLGDIISVKVADLYRSELLPHSKEVTERYLEKNKEKKEMFQHKEVKLVRESKFVTMHFLEDDELIIEYFCEFADENN